MYLVERDHCPDPDPQIAQELTRHSTHICHAQFQIPVLLKARLTAGQGRA
jgi:hypothetical protein